MARPRGPGRPTEAERRRRARREADRQLAREAAFLARAIDLAMEDVPAATRLGDLLALVARTSGAAMAGALVPSSGTRTAYVAAREGDRERAEELGRWLAATTGETTRRSVGALRANAGGTGDGLATAGGRGADDGERDILLEPDAPNPAAAAIGPLVAAADAPRVRITVVSPRRPGSGTPGRRMHPRVLALPGRRHAAIGLAFRSERAAALLERRFPPALAGHTAVALASLIAQVGSERVLADLRHAEAERQKFVRTVAHELRTPLSSLSGYLDLAARHEDDRAAQRAFLERAGDLVDATSTLVADLLELSRLGAGQLTLEIGRLSASDTARAAIRDVEPLALGRGIAVAATGLPTRLRTITADRRRVQQILVNLLANAIKFSPRDSEVSLGLAFDGPAAVFTVRDSGAGIEPAERAAIFEPFHRASGAERVVGTGLGLPIARELAQRMGGDVGVASVVGRGSVFAVALPALADAAPRAVAAVLARRLATAQRALAAGNGRVAGVRAEAAEAPIPATAPVGGLRSGPAGDAVGLAGTGATGAGPVADIHIDQAAPGAPSEGYPHSSDDRVVGG